MENRRITSRKRQAMYDLLCESTEHPTAEMLFSRMKGNYPKLSLGTVYRNLSVLEEDGLLVRVGNVNGQERYDARLDPHAHFVCSCCYSVSDIELQSDALKTLLREMEQQFHCKAESVMLTVKGICARCRDAQS